MLAILDRTTPTHFHAVLDQEQAIFTIKVRGRFEMSAFADFNNLYRDVLRLGLTYRIDLRECVAIDSGAVGMLILMRDHALLHKATDVVLELCEGQVARAAEALCLRQLFSIELTRDTPRPEN